MGFKKSSFYEGVQDHKAVERDPELPDGRHRVKVKNCIRFLSRDGQPVSIVQAQLLSSNAPEAVVGETYGIGFFLNTKYPYYFFTEIKRFVTAATQGNYNDENIDAELLENIFIDRDEGGDKLSPFADVELDIVVKTGVGKDGKQKKRVDFRSIQEVA